jgi:hypothetical protein
MNWISRNPGARRPPWTALVLLLLAPGAVSSLHAQYELKSGVYNRLSYRVPASNPGHIAPVGPLGTPTGDPTINLQYSNVVESSGGSARGSSGSPNSIVSGVGVTLTHSGFGTTFASGVPRYLFGDEIKPPTTLVSASGTNYAVDASYWRTQPVFAGEVLTNPNAAIPTTDFKTGEPSSLPALPEGILASYYPKKENERVRGTPLSEAAGVCFGWW